MIKLPYFLFHVTYALNKNMQKCFKKKEKKRKHTCIKNSRSQNKRRVHKSLHKDFKMNKSYINVFVKWF